MTWTEGGYIVAGSSGASICRIISVKSGLSAISHLRRTNRGRAPIRMKSEASSAYTARKADFCWEEWDDRYVLFHRASQKTHYLNETSAVVLQCVAESPYEADTLANTLAEESGEPLSEGLRRSISKLLQRLETQGLVVRITNPGPEPLTKVSKA